MCCKGKKLKYATAKAAQNSRRVIIGNLSSKRHHPSTQCSRSYHSDLKPNSNSAILSLSTDGLPFSCSKPHVSSPDGFFLQQQ